MQASGYFFSSCSQNTLGVCVFYCWFIHWTPSSTLSHPFPFVPTQFYTNTLTFVVNLIIFNDWLITLHTDKTNHSKIHMSTMEHGWKFKRMCKVRSCALVDSPVRNIRQWNRLFLSFLFSCTLRLATETIQFYRWSKSPIFFGSRSCFSTCVNKFIVRGCKCIEYDCSMKMSTECDYVWSVENHTALYCTITATHIWNDQIEPKRNQYPYNFQMIVF